jgi:hypothetical protein
MTRIWGELWHSACVKGCLTNAIMAILHVYISSEPSFNCHMMKTLVTEAVQLRLYTCGILWKKIADQHTTVNMP